jgi:hypothetical protein
MRMYMHILGWGFQGFPLTSYEQVFFLDRILLCRREFFNVLKRSSTQVLKHLCISCKRDRIEV